MSVFHKIGPDLSSDRSCGSGLESSSPSFSPDFSPYPRSASYNFVCFARSVRENRSGTAVERRDAASERLCATLRAPCKSDASDLRCKVPNTETSVFGCRQQCVSNRLPDAPHRAARFSCPVAGTTARRPWIGVESTTDAVTTGRGE